VYQKLCVGEIINTHGIKGEVKVIPLTDDISAFNSINKVSIDNKDYEIESFREHKNVLLIKFRGFDDIKNEDEDGNTIDYDDPVSAIETCVVPLEAGEWRTTMIVDYYKNNYLSITEGQYLLIRFENNSWIGNQKGYSKMEFMLTNLLICAQGS
jgi:hypothetical protein